MAQTIFQDAFTGESANVNLDTHTPDTTGTSWVMVEETGTRTLDVKGTNANVGPSGADSTNRALYKSQPDPNSPEYDVSFLVSAAANSSDSMFLLGRLTDTSNYYGAVVKRGTESPDRILYKKVAGTVTQLASKNQGTPVGVVVKLEIKDATKKIFDDGVEQVSSTDNALTSTGSAGVGVGNAFTASGINSLWRFDNFLVVQTGAQLVTVNQVTEVDAAQAIGVIPQSFVKTVEAIDFGPVWRDDAGRVTLSMNQNKDNCIVFPSVYYVDNSAHGATYNVDFYFDPAQTRDVLAKRVDYASGGPDGYMYPNAVIVEVDSTKATVRKGTFALAAGETSIAVNIGATVDMAKSFLIFSHNAATYTDYATNYEVKGKMLSTTQVQFDRVGNTDAVDGHWTLVTAAGNEFSVQRREVVIAGSTSSADSTAFSAIENNKTFLIASCMTDEPNKNYESSFAPIIYLKGAGPTSTQVTVERAGATVGVTATYEVQIITFGTGDTVSSGVATTTTADTFVDATGVPQNRSMPWMPQGHRPTLQINTGTQGTTRVSYAKLSWDGSNLKIHRVVDPPQPAKVAWQIVQWQTVSGTIVLGQSNEVETAMTVTTHVPVERVTETDQAQSIAIQKIQTIGQVVEADLAQAITPLKLAALTEAVEADLSQTIVPLDTRLIAQIAEADLAQPVSLIITKLIGQISEADLAQAVAWAPIHRLITGAEETDLSQAMAHAFGRAIDQVTEADLAQPITINIARTIGQAIEADLAQPVIKVGTILIAQISELDAAYSVASHLIVGQISEADLAQAVTPFMGSSVNQVFETDLAQAVAWAPMHRLIDQALELDAAQSLSHAKIKEIVQATEADLAQTVIGRKLALIDQAIEADLAQALAQIKTGTIGQALEADTADAVTRIYFVNVAAANETDLAQAIAFYKTLGIGQVLETDLAQAISEAGALQPSMIVLAKIKGRAPKILGVVLKAPRIEGAAAKSSHIETVEAL